MGHCLSQSQAMRLSKWIKCQCAITFGIVRVTRSFKVVMEKEVLSGNEVSELEKGPFHYHYKEPGICGWGEVTCREMYMYREVGVVSEFMANVLHWGRKSRDS